MIMMGGKTTWKWNFICNCNLRMRGIWMILYMLVFVWEPPVAITFSVRDSDFCMGHTKNGSFCPFSSKDWFINRNWRYSHRMIMLCPTSFTMGSSPPHAIPGDNEEERAIELCHPFWMDRNEVTTEDFSEFVIKTNYSTVAEELGNSFVFHLELNREEKTGIDKGKRVWWWVEKSGVHWKEGVSSHPVAHVSYDDAVAYCTWRGARLPTEPEWEYACRAESKSVFPWGDILHPSHNSHMTNIWQGQFPLRNTEKDGFPFTAPVRSFPPNSFGFFDLIGNVWEWVDGHWDWRLSNRSKSPDDYGLNPNVRVQKGGSFLCHRNHCFRYRCGARTKGTRDSTASNLGFRCAAHLH